MISLSFMNVVDLGLLYHVDITEDANVKITMTQTAPGYPLYDRITRGVRFCVKGIEETKKGSRSILFGNLHGHLTK